MRLKTFVLTFEIIKIRFQFMVQIWINSRNLWADGLLGGVILNPPNMENTPQIRHWCFTSYRDAWPNWIPDKMHYLVYQVELCPDTGRAHLQGYVEFKRSMRLGSAKKLLGDPTAHFEPRQGSRDQARAYCMKEESRQNGPWEHGDWMQGTEKRSELQEAIEAIKSGVPWTNIVEDFTGVAVRHYKNLKLIWNQFNIKPRNGAEQVHSIYIYGDAGVGKTRFAYWWAARCDANPYTSYIRGWWEGYLGQQWSVYDDFDGAAHMDVGNFKKICDRYPVTVQCKGGSSEYCSAVNIFTSNLYPLDWYPREHWPAVKRRGSHQIWWREHRVVQCQADSCGEDCPVISVIREYWDELDGDLFA